MSLFIFCLFFFVNDKTVILFFAVSFVVVVFTFTMQSTISEFMLFNDHVQHSLMTLDRLCGYLTSL